MRYAWRLKVRRESRTVCGVLDYPLPDRSQFVPIDPGRAGPSEDTVAYIDSRVLGEVLHRRRVVDQHLAEAIKCPLRII